MIMKWRFPSAGSASLVEGQQTQFNAFPRWIIPCPATNGSRQSGTRSPLGPFAVQGRAHVLDASSVGCAGMGCRLKRMLHAQETTPTRAKWVLRILRIEWPAQRVSSACANRTALDKRGIARQPERFEDFRLDALGKRVDFVHTQARGAHAVPQSPLSRGSFHNLQNSIGHFLGISGCGR